MNAAASLATPTRHPLRYVALGGIAAGTLDLIYICTLYAFKGVSPVRILQSIAAGWLGRDAADYLARQREAHLAEMRRLVALQESTDEVEARVVIDRRSCTNASTIEWSSRTCRRTSSP